jgi:hypothetical protein
VRKVIFIVLVNRWGNLTKGFKTMDNIRDFGSSYWFSDGFHLPFETFISAMKTLSKSKVYISWGRFLILSFIDFILLYIIHLIEILLIRKDIIGSNKIINNRQYFFNTIKRVKYISICTMHDCIYFHQSRFS